MSSHHVGSAVLLPLLLWPTLYSGGRPSATNLAAANLQPYTFNVRQRAGAQHQNADGLSRGPPTRQPSPILRWEECNELMQS